MSGALQTHQRRRRSTRSGPVATASLSFTSAGSSDLQGASSMALEGGGGDVFVHEFNARVRWACARVPCAQSMKWGVGRSKEALGTQAQASKRIQSSGHGRPIRGGFSGERVQYVKSAGRGVQGSEALRRLQWGKQWVTAGRLGERYT